MLLIRMKYLDCRSSSMTNSSTCLWGQVHSSATSVTWFRGGEHALKHVSLTLWFTDNSSLLNLENSAWGKHIWSTYGGNTLCPAKRKLVQNHQHIPKCFTWRVTGRIITCGLRSTELATSWGANATALHSSSIWISKPRFSSIWRAKCYFPVVLHNIGALRPKEIDETAMIRACNVKIIHSSICLSL